MQKPLSSNIAGYLKAHLQKKRWKQVVTVLACLVVFGTTYALILPAITMTGETFCGKQAHTHSEEAGCYTQGEPHVHTEDCYEEASVLTCGLAETEGHTHGDSCYDEDSNLICGQEEADAHTHTEDCYTTQKTLVCGKGEGAAESVLTCKLEEHEHTLACYSNPDADTVAPALPALSGNAAADAAAIAKAQLGYTESSKNYAVAPDGETTYGYTCYGAAYGNAYADDWSALFARYCLDKAGVSEAFPRADTCAGWLAALAAQELYRDAAGYAPKPGDVAFYDLDGDGAAEHTGIVLDAETAAVGDVNGKVEKEALTAAAGFGALPASGPKKAAAAAPSKPTFELTFSGKSHGADGKWLFYTGETFKANVSLSDNAQDGEQTTEDDGMVARIYMRFTKTVPPTGNTSVNGAPSVKSGTITANSGSTYTITVTRIAGADPNHYTYCYDIQRPRSGDTLNIDLPCAYPSPDSAGGTVEIWGMILTEEEKEALDGGSTPGIQEPAEGEAVTAHWETKRDDFTLSKTNATSSRLPYVSFDDDGKPTITQLRYHVDVKRNTTETLEGIGKDFLVSVDYVDTLMLPENTYFDTEVIEAANNGTYVLGSITPDHASGGDHKSYYYYVTKDTKKPVFAITRSEVDEVAIKFSEDRRSVSISWTQKNSKYTTSEYSGTSVGIQLPDIHIEKLEEGLDYTVCNNVTATYHYRWSENVPQTDFCKNTVSLGKAEMSYRKSRGTGNSNGGSGIVYRISAENKGSMPFEKLAFIKDPLPDVLYMSAADMYTMFTDKTYGKGFSIEISHAAICEANNLIVKTIDGSEAAATVTWVSPDDVEGKYSGMWKDKDPTVLTADASFKIGWNEEKAALTISRLASEGVEAKSIPCELTTEAIQTALDELGLFVTSKTIYQLQWDLRDENEQPKPIYNGHPVSIELRCTNKNTFMRLTGDSRWQYPKKYDPYSNSADFQDTDRKLLGNASHSSRWNREISLYKSAALPDGSAITDKNAPQNGDIVNYALTINYSTDYNSYYALLPVTDHMTGAQVLLAEKGKNASAGWAAKCPTVTVDGTDYYKLSQEGTYSGVWLSNYYADTVTVSKTSAGRDTLIKWYFKNYKRRTNDIRYKALVCPQELSVSGMTFTLDNESWLNDHAAHRLYDTIGTITGSAISFDKKIVSESDVGAAQKEAGKTESSVSEGETVYYRIALHPAGEGSASEKAGSVTLNGQNLRDSLPLGFSINDTNKFEWHKSENAEDKTPGSVWVVGYEGATTVTGGWNIADSSTKNQQEIVWDNDFSVTFPSNKPLYIYIRLTFPSGATWQDYAVQNNKLPPTNTFYLNDMGSAVTHTLKLEAKAYLQKGVYRNYYYKNDDYVDYVTHSDLTGYLNGKGVIYYVALCNDGDTRLYLTDMQDILPKGFRFDSLGPSGHKTWHKTENTTPTTAMVMRKDNGRSYQMKFVNINCVKDGNDPQKLTFQFSPKSTSYTSVISYDEARRLCYLNPGEAINFCYRALIGYTASTDEAATNGIAMPYYDYNLGGVSISDNALILSQTTTDVDNPNDGDCRLVDNTQIASGGFTGVSNDTQWLYSEVTQYRSEIKPGISKRLVAAVSTNGAVTENPVAARPEDTLRWEVTVYNDGSTPLEDFTVTDVMQFPYKFTGKVLWNGMDGELFSITSLDEEKGFVEGYFSKQEVAVNGDEVAIYTGGVMSGNVYVRVTRDEATGNYALSIRFPAEYFALSAGDTLRLTYETARSDGGNQNTVFVNTCYVTPSNAQNWDGTTNHGNVTTFDPNGEDPNRLSVRNSAPVTTAYGFATSSLKTVELTGNPTQKATGSDGINYIVLPDKDTRNITYTLQVDAPEGKPMTSLTFIDTLPCVGDHTSFQSDDPRFSEFAVDFADNPNVTVTVTDKDGLETTLDAGRYTVSYSNQKEFSSDDWRGTSKWSASPAGMRTLRVAITDEQAIPAESHVAVRFNAVVSSDADYGQSAWNSFGYHYSVDSGQELEAAPLKVGVKMPTRPYLQKSLVDREDKSVIAKKDETFRFLLYSGKSLKTADEATIAERANEVSVIDLTVLTGESVSDKMMLKDLKVWTYADGEWTKTDKDWTWTQNRSYTIIELPQSDDPEYRFQSLNRRTDATGYTFIYQNDQTQLISAVNRHDVWSLTIRKVDQTAQDLTIAGAWFALYSPDENDRLVDYGSLCAKPTNMPAETIEKDSKTWYLAQVAQTGNVESEQGSLTWSGLRRETYLYQEIQAPKGYKLDPTIRTITKTDYPQTVTVTNEGAGYELPQTGGPGVAPFLLSGGLIFGGTAFALLRRRKRKGAA